MDLDRINKTRQDDAYIENMKIVGKAKLEQIQEKLKQLKYTLY
jgi:DNA-directed RNA polymerase alpha subunit